MEREIRFHHFGIACKDIKKTAECYEQMGYDVGETVLDTLQNVNICFLSHPTMPLVELLSPVNESSPVVEILAKIGVTPYHTCYEVDDLDSTIRTFRKDGYVIVAKPKNACAIENRRVSFLYNPNMGLIELVEK